MPALTLKAAPLRPSPGGCGQHVVCAERGISLFSCVVLTLTMVHDMPGSCLRHIIKTIQSYISPAISIGDFISQLFNIAIDVALFRKNKEPSIGERILPAGYKQNRKAVLLANTLIWVSIVAAAIAVVALLS